MEEFKAFIALNRLNKEKFAMYNNINEIQQIPHLLQEVKPLLEVLDNPRGSLKVLQETFSKMEHEKDIKRLPISVLSIRSLLQKYAYEENLEKDKDLCTAFCLLTKMKNMTTLTDLKLAKDKLKSLLFTKKQLIEYEYKIGNLNYVV